MGTKSSTKIRVGLEPFRYTFGGRQELWWCGKCPCVLPAAPGPSSAPRPPAQGSAPVFSCKPFQKVLRLSWSNTSQAHLPTGEAGAPHRQETGRAARSATPSQTAEGRPAGGTSGKGLGSPAPPSPHLGSGRGLGPRGARRWHALHAGPL